MLCLRTCKGDFEDMQNDPNVPYNTAIHPTLRYRTFRHYIPLRHPDLLLLVLDILKLEMSQIMYLLNCCIITEQNNLTNVIIVIAMVTFMLFNHKLLQHTLLSNIFNWMNV